MLKNLLFLLLFIFTFNVSSQNIERTIILKDEESNLPIEDATVFILKTKQNLISNSEGQVSFVLKGNTNIEKIM